MKYKKYFLTIIGISLLFSYELKDIDHIIGIRVQFQKEKEEFEDLNGNGQWDENEPVTHDINNNGIFDYWDLNNNGQYDHYEHFDNPLTSGLGTFLNNKDEYYARMDLSKDDIPDNINVDVFNDEVIEKYCKGFLVDRPPHNKPYFEDQMTAVKNYFYNISNETINFSYSVLDNVYTLSNQMEHYAKSDNALAQLFVESFSLDQVKEDVEILINEIGSDKEFLIVIFHAGTSQDFELPGFDNTIYDIKSAYIDDSMMENLVYPQINSKAINNVIILPETQNMIYYRSIEENFFSENDFCDYQIGLTGTFAFWVGYAIGLPLMYNTDSGNTGIGMFGLMDIGSNNGRGIIPALPNPWTRSLYNWSNVVDISSEIAQGVDLELSSDREILKINIDEDEYFLVENRNNWTGSDISTSIDSIRWMNRFNDTKKAYWFDTVIDELDSKITISENSVITSIDSYDYGLPGSGILIWHIKKIDGEPLAVNNDLNNRYVQLEEADGAIDLGYESYNPFFDAQTTGWGYDFWYADNYYYFNYGGNSEQLTNEGALVFSNTTNPSSKTSDGAETNVSITVNSPIKKNMTLTVKREISENYLVEEYDEIVKIIGASIGSVFYVDLNNKICRKTSEGKDLNWVEFDYSGSEYVLCDNNNNCQIADSKDSYCINDDCSSELNSVDYNSEDFFSVGYYSNFDRLDTLNENVSLGDIDNDGLDEKLWFEDDKIFSKNSNGILSDDFPFKAYTQGQKPLIADINNDDQVDLIFKTDRGLEIVDMHNDNTIIIPVSSYLDHPIIIQSWKQDSLAIATGNKFYIFPQNLDKLFWVTEYGRYSHYPKSLVDSIDREQGHDLFIKPQAYNYPNPIENSYTKIRFFSKSSKYANLNIYNSLGAYIYNHKIDDLNVNDYNEFGIDASTSNFEPGVYFIELDYEGNEKSELIKMLWIK